MGTRTARHALVGALLLAGIAVAGCGSSGSSAKTSSTAPADGSSSTPTTAGHSGSSAGGAASGTVDVDLALTGDLPVKIKGTKGACNIPSNPSMMSGYNFGTADYPALGANGGVYVTGPQLATGGGQASGGQNAFPAGIKVLLKGAGFLDNGRGSIIVSADRKKVTIDSDLGGSKGGTIDHPGTPLHEHIKGSITCG